jgi:hypothetical protein
LSAATGIDENTTIFTTRVGAATHMPRERPDADEATRQANSLVIDLKGP